MDWNELVGIFLMILNIDIQQLLNKTIKEWLIDKKATKQKDGYDFFC